MWVLIKGRPATPLQPTVFRFVFFVSTSINLIIVHLYTTKEINQINRWKNRYTYNLPQHTFRSSCINASTIQAHAEVFPELVEPARSGYGWCALIRELHVYGQLVLAGEQNTSATATQHCGYGARLLREAENYSGTRGFTKISVIAGVGTRGYYRKRGYALQEGEGSGEMMTKRIPHRFRLYPDGMMFVIQLLIIVAVITYHGVRLRTPGSTQL